MHSNTFFLLHFGWTHFCSIIEISFNQLLPVQGTRNEFGVDHLTILLREFNLSLQLKPTEQNNKIMKQVNKICKCTKNVAWKSLEVSTPTRPFSEQLQKTMRTFSSIFFMRFLYKFQWNQLPPQILMLFHLAFRSGCILFAWFKTSFPFFLFSLEPCTYIDSATTNGVTSSRRCNC